MSSPLRFILLRADPTHACRENLFNPHPVSHRFSTPVENVGGVEVTEM